MNTLNINTFYDVRNSVVPFLYDVFGNVLEILKTKIIP